MVISVDTTDYTTSRVISSLPLLQMQLLQKIEELTLYIIEQDKRIEQLKKEVENLKIGGQNEE